jgi:hypothetical protein
MGSALRCDEMCAVIPMNPLEIIDDPFLEEKKRKRETKQQTGDRDIESHKADSVSHSSEAR